MPMMNVHDGWCCCALSIFDGCPWWMVMLVDLHSESDVLMYRMGVMDVFGVHDA